MRESDTSREPTKERRGWHLDKSVNLPFLLALFIAGMGAMGYISAQNNRQTIVETKQANQEVELKNIKTDFKNDLMRLENSSIRMEQKLDRIIEKGR